MKYLKTLYVFILLLPLILFCSCEGIIGGKGKVLSSVNSEPIDSVKIILSGGQVTYSNEKGEFENDNFVGCVPDCPSELIFYKKGFKTRHIDTRNDYDNREKMIVYLDQETGEPVDYKINKIQYFLFYVALFFSLLNIFTFIMILVMKTKNKGLWAIASLLISLRLSYNFVNGSIEVEFLNFFLQIFTSIYLNMGWYVYFIPASSLAFWICFFLKRKYPNNKKIKAIV